MRNFSNVPCVGYWKEQVMFGLEKRRLRMGGDMRAATQQMDNSHLKGSTLPGSNGYEYRKSKWRFDVKKNLLTNSAVQKFKWLAHEDAGSCPSHWGPSNKSWVTNSQISCNGGSHSGSSWTR